MHSKSITAAMPCIDDSAIIVKVSVVVLRLIAVVVALQMLMEGVPERTLYVKCLLCSDMLTI